MPVVIGVSVMCVAGVVESEWHMQELLVTPKRRAVTELSDLEEHHQNHWMH